jgi:hypothetical protein
MATTERGRYRFSAGPTAEGTFWITAEPVGDTIASIPGQLGFALHAGLSLEDAVQFSELMNRAITAIVITKE